MRLLAALVLVVLCAGCQVTGVVGVDVHRDGSGVVRVGVGLDADAVRRAPNLKDDLRVDDLRRAGWTVRGPAKESDGRMWVRASKPFADPADAGRVLQEVSGPDGPFRDLRVTRSSSFFKTKTSVRGLADLRGGLEAFGDADLRHRLGGSSLGVPEAQLADQLGAALDRLVRFRVVARLPGTVTSNAPGTADGGAAWQPKLGERVELVATAEAWNTRRIVGLVVAALAALALIAVLVVRAGRGGGRRRRRARSRSAFRSRSGSGSRSGSVNE